MPRTIALGDIHGCAAAFDAVLDALQPRSDDTLVILGDVIDRGPASRDVVERLLALRQRLRLVTLRGNHELMLLAAAENEVEYDFWLRYGGRQTLASYGKSLDDIPPAHWEFFRALLPYYEIPGFYFVHAHYAADVNFEDQPDYLRYWEHLHAEQLPPPHESGRTVLVGHTAQRSGEILDGGHVICLDTCCHGGGWLTALDVHSRKIWQADRLGRMRG